MSEKLPIEIESLIPKLSITQLQQLNRQVVERIKMINNMSTLEEVAKFKLGDKVSFDYSGGIKTGTIIRLNKKSVSVTTDDDIKWNVSPNLISKVIDGSLNDIEQVQEIVKDDSQLELVGDFTSNDNNVGRNDPCLCGSGKKYKKCCGK